MVLFSLLLTLFVLLRNPTVQTYTAQIAAEYLSEKLNTEIRIKELTVTAFFDIVIKGVDVKDLHQKSMIQAERIQLNIKKSSIRNREIGLNKIFLDRCSFNLVVYETDTITNIEALLNVFQKAENTAQENDTISSENNAWQLSCDAVEVSESSFSLANQTKPKWPRGVDYDYLDITNLNLNLDDLSVLGDSLIFTINKLSLKDKNSGFGIDSFKGEFILSNTILDSKNLKNSSNGFKTGFGFQF